MSELASDRCADCGLPFTHSAQYRLVKGRAVCRDRGRCQWRQSLRFPVKSLVRVKGNADEQRTLYGRDVIGAVGEVLYPVRRSQGVNRYLVRIAAHDYVTEVKKLVRHIAAFEIVLREDHIERVEMPAESAPAAAAVRTCRACGCTDEQGCDNGCWWVEEDLCSNCVGAPAAAESERESEVQA